ncbi:hypothetical protein [Actinocrispum wychmicini]|uniref:Uncharacterized protein n=1 Tax=Actinocrispum wychmicini TaxID=1213861 RepID=A0A4R2J672_9PSEU|nr:hypothetical protein [Actinocrispum wychmicini]TCO53517.1 hypothetical protein EV192_110106 [Actinocrispum wychmicini]
MVTFCLAPAQRADLADAVVALEIDDRTALTDLPTWRKAHPDGFTRACTALYESAKGSGSSGFASVLPFLTGLFGAVLAFLAAAFVDLRARGRALGDNLRTAVTDFHERGDVFLRGIKVGAADSELVRARRKLVNQLADVKARHPKWHLVTTALEPLDDTLGPAMGQGWDDNATRSRDRVRDLTESLNELRDNVLTIAAGLAVVVGSHKAVKEVKGGGAKAVGIATTAETAAVAAEERP